MVAKVSREAKANEERPVSAIQHDVSGTALQKILCKT